MTKFYKFNILIILIILLATNSFGQQMSTRGKDFWMGFMNNNSSTADLSIYISSTQNTSGTVSIPGLAWSQNFNVTANTTTRVIIPTNAAVMTSGVVENKAVHITTIDSVTVFALSYQSATSDAAIIFPTQALDREYRILTIQGWPYNAGEEYLIVATENNSTIEITPFGGTAYTINLNIGQVYQISSSSQLSGATVKDLGTCHKIAVFVGNLCANIGGCTYCDHLFEQLLPVSRWGKNFITTPLMNKAIDYFQIIANYNNTSVTINGGAPILLNQGQFHQFSTGAPSFIQSSQPVFVMQYAQGVDCDGVGDPFALIVPPMEQSIKDITFNAFSSALVNSFYTNIVTRTAYTSSLTLDGSAITFAPVPANPIYSYARIAISTGNHHVVSNFGFTASVYGFGQAESYGYSGGFSLNNLQYDFTAVPNVVCLGNPINFSTQPFNNIDNYQWIFGDGTFGSGLNVTHTYTRSNNFRVGLVLSENGGCRIDTIWKTLTIGAVPEANFSFNNSCEKSPVQITNNSTMNGGPFTGSTNWTFGDGQSDTLINTTHTYADSGVYNITLMVKSNDGCMDSLTKSITIYPKPQINVVPLDSTICGLGNIVLNASGANLYSWSPNSYITANNGDNIISSPLADIQYTVIGSNYFGCKDTAYCRVYYLEKPVVNIGADKIICPPETALLNVNNNYANYSIIWSDNSTNSSLQTETPGKYWVRVDNQGCMSSDTIELIQCQDLWVPNCFTPDKNHINDYFYAISSNPSLIIEFKLCIFNRWGDMMFESNDISTQWDGSYKGNLCEAGVFYWMIQCRSMGANNEKKFIERWGSVSIIR